MTSIDVLSENFWDNLYASNIRFRIFVRDIIQRIIISGETDLIDLLLDTTPIVEAYSDEIDLLSKNMSDQRFATALKNQTIVEYQLGVRGLEGAVVEIFKGRKSIQYTTEFFPKKLTEFNKINEFTADGLFNRTKDLTTKYVLQLGVDRQTRFANFSTSYNSAHSTQFAAKAKVTKSNSDIKTTVKDVKDIMYRNILMIGAHYYKTPASIKNFYREMLLHCRHTNKAGIPIEKPYKANIAKLAILLADISYLVTESLLFENLGLDSLYYFTSDVELEVLVIPQDAEELIAGEEKIIEASTLKKILYFGNKSTTEVGKIQLSNM